MLRSIFISELSLSVLFLSTVETDSPQSVKEDRGLVVTTYLELPKILIVTLKNKQR